ncbi:MAG: hypothetical protein KIT56_03500 [Gammaproteobacteria bacterium]|nr:hypothetical protein [Gammaproteobacteria bacterium]MCW5582943.1 hypothetical protein [Gammaproteobacteria bacterium]
MLKIFLERLLPPKPLDEPVQLNLSDKMSIEDSINISKQVINLMGNEEITPEQAKTMFATVKYYQESVVLHDLLSCIKRLEKHMQK